MAALKELREKRDLSQHGLARKSGVDQGHISRIESGQSGYSVDVIERLAEGLGVDGMALMLALGMEAIQSGAAGKLGPAAVAEKSAQIIGLAAEAPGGLLTDADVDRLAGVAAEAMAVAEKAAGRAAQKSASSQGFDLFGELGRNPDGTARLKDNYRLREGNYGGAQGVNPEERQLGRELGGARVRRGPVADGEPGPALRNGAAGADALGRDAGGRKLRKLYG